MANSVVISSRLLGCLFSKHALSTGSSHMKIVFQQSAKMSSTFDINQIVKQNEGTGKAKKSTVSKTRKKATALPVTEQINAPDCFTVILDTPMCVGDTIDAAKHEQFKDYIEELEIGYIPSVSQILKKTEPQAQQVVLQRWMENKAKELGGEELFKAYQQATLRTGLDLHKCIENSLKGETDVSVSPACVGHWKSVKGALGEVTDVVALEEEVVHSDVFYGGKFDCVAKLRDTLCLIEWKTSSKPKPLLSGTYDNPIQVAAYIGAVNRSGILKQFDISNVTKGALVYAYPSGEPATVHIINQKTCEKYWQRWLNRLYLYWATRFHESR